ncbi:MAG: PspC domain-containing protein [Bacteroidales bacterium]|jgi:phage shock protein PspC (stress-responsive transcriptional regulator)|nr:PspC domain-containing protein [Bacteroidales bacterium]
MKSVITIHINGIVFNIEDDAYHKLSAYLDTLTAYFQQEPGGNEIIADIEARLAELFVETAAGTVVTLADVTRALETLGSPEDITGTAETDPDGHTHTASEREKTTKRLYRDPDGRYIGGVCAGIANRLGINPAIVRILFIIGLFFGGMFAGIYLLLWLIIPLAKTTAQKLQMRGESVNVNNIWKHIQEEISTDASLQQSFRQFISEAGELFDKVVRIFFRIVGIGVGLLLILTGIGSAVLMFCVYFMQGLLFEHSVEWDFLPFHELLRHVVSPAAYYTLCASGIIVAALMVFALIFWGVRLMTKFRIRYKIVHVALLLTWFGGIVLIAVTVMVEFRHHAWRNDVIETKMLPVADTLYLKAIPSEMKISNNPLDIYYDRGNGRFYGMPHLSIHKSEDDRIRLRIRKEANGRSKMDAYRYAEDISYHVTVCDSLLLFPSFFSVEPPHQWNFQFLNMTLYVPEGTVIIPDKLLCDKIFGGSHHAYYRHKWIMEKNGLHKLEE